MVEAPVEKKWRVYIGFKSDYPNIDQILGLGYQKTFGSFYYDICGELGKHGDDITGEVKMAVEIRF